MRKLLGRGMACGRARTTRLIWLVFALSLTQMSEAAAQEVQSCAEVAHGKSGPGAASCAPWVDEKQAAFEVIDTFGAKKIGHDWYVFWPEKMFKQVSYEKRWLMIAGLVSAIQSLYGTNVDVLVVLPPSGEADRLQLMMGQYPMEKVKAQAKYEWQRTKSNLRYPRNHHERLYTLIVYRDEAIEPKR